jgi:protein-L-isoaspartate(D-aspartate) O-methyltransferase
MSVALAAFLRHEGIRDARVLAAVAQVRRERFLPEDLRPQADDDRPLPIGHGQTISQPYIVAYMTERLHLGGGERVLEVGTGSGYQTAILAHLAEEVFSVEIVPELAERARSLLRELGLSNVRLREGDGAAGWPEEAPFDRVIVTAAARDVPPALVEQLAPGGRMILPVGGDPDQVLRVIDRAPGGALAEADLLAVRFVPLTHR